MVINFEKPLAPKESRTVVIPLSSEGGAFCDPVLYGTRARGPGVFIKTQKPSNFSKTVVPR